MLRGKHCSGGRDVLNLPTPAPMPDDTAIDADLCAAESCSGGLNLSVQDAEGANPYCDECDGTGVTPLRVALHATSEGLTRTGVSSLYQRPLPAGVDFDCFDPYGDQYALCPDDPRQHTDDEFDRLILPFDHVVAVATITGSHPSYECFDAQRAWTGEPPMCSGWAQLADRDPMHVHDADVVQHWQVAEVVAVDPVPWAGGDAVVGVLPGETSRAIEAQL